MGPGSPSLCLKYRKRAIATHSLLKHHTCQNWMTVKKFRCCFFRCKIIFVALNFRGFGQPRKFFNGLPVPCVKKMETYERACCVRGYHVYRHIWSAAVGEVLSCEREPTNSRDRYAVAVKKDEVAIGHLPRKVSRICSLFLRRGGAIHCRVSGGRRYSSDLPQGGLEIPCQVIFSAKLKEIKKLKRSLKT